MTNLYKNSKSYGVSFKYWHDLLIKYFDEKKLSLEKLEYRELVNLYHANYTIEEVYTSFRSRHVYAATLQLTWFDDFGRMDVKFSDNDEIRHFYKQNPDIKKIMEKKKGKYC